MFWRVQITSSPGIWKPRDHCEIMFQNNLKGLVPSLQVHPMVLSDGPTCVTYWIDMWKLESFWNTTVSPQSGPPTSYKSGYNSMYRSYNSSYPLIGLPKPARLMEDILHHLAHIKPYEYWDVSTTSTGAGFLPWINSSTNPQFTSRFLETAHEWSPSENGNGTWIPCWGGDYTPQSSSDKVIGSLGKARRITDICTQTPTPPAT